MSVFDEVLKLYNDYFHPKVETPSVETIEPRSYAYVYAWECSRCHKHLRIRSRVPHATGPSNYLPGPVGHRYAGHSMLPSSDLTQEGLAAERGWSVTNGVVRCPRCR